MAPHEIQNRSITVFLSCTVWPFAACRRLCIIVAVLATCMAASGKIGNAQDVAHEKDSLVGRVNVGITGHYRIGRWTTIRLDGGIGQEEFSVETMDGDGVRVVYDQPVQASSSSGSRYGYVVPGTEAAPLRISIDSQDSISTRFPEIGSPSRGPSAVPSDMRWVVCIGDPMGVDEIGANELLKRDALIAVSKPTNAKSFPDSVLGYDGVDMIMINRPGYHILGELSKKQSDALVESVKTGGRLFLTLGESVGALAEAAPWLLEMLPLGDQPLTKTQFDPSAVETYTAAQTPLEQFGGIRLPKGVGEVLLNGRTTRRVSTPIAVEYTVGFGRVTVIAADLDSERFATWPDRMTLMKRLTGSVFVVQQEQEALSSRLTAFDDLAGQTRATLDRFSVKRSFGFSVLALVIMALIALIGPLDYLLINRVFGKPLLGWLTFPLAALGLSAVLVMQALPAKTAAGTNQSTGGLTSQSGGDGSDNERLVQCNRIEIFDIDAQDATGAGFAWSFLYTHPANQFDVDVQSSEQLESISNSMQYSHTAPFGTPGTAFGGIQIAGEDARLPRYRIVADYNTDDAAGGDDGIRSNVRDLALAPRSSKSLASRLKFQPDVSRVKSVRRRRGSELLEGALVNPLPVDLLDGMLVYGNWVYLLPTRFVAGGQIDSLADLRQKNFRWQLSRQKMLKKNAVQRETWEPSNYDSPNRMAEMLMFHQSVGGYRYTGLNHQPLSFLDLSHVLTEHRCMLVGRLRDPLLNIQLTDSNDDKKSVTGETLTMVRVVLPVESSRR